MVSLDPKDLPEDSADGRSNQDQVSIQQVFSTEGLHPFDDLTWENRSTKIADDKGNTIFEQSDVEVPSEWSQLATTVVVSKYFYGEHGTDQREHSVKQLIHRVTRTITDWAKQDGVFASDQDGERFYQELTWLCVNQYGSFNSPVWFNVGLYQQNGVAGSGGSYHWDTDQDQPVRTEKGYEYPQTSACFIQSVSDNLEDIMRVATSEAMLFKYGSGTGTDLSTLRSSREKLSGGGTPSGPLSFMRVYDQIAGVIKSGGKTRRAAKMQSLRCDHPDILEFICCKMQEERKAWALIERGYDGSFNGDAYGSVMFQNANLSVRLSDEFMEAALDGSEWQTYAVTNGKPISKYKAAKLLKLIAEGTHVCGDPGVQYHTTINKWHTCPNSGEICASNPCSEYMFLNDSACNLASLNVAKFRREDGSFDIERFQAAIRVFIIAQDVLVDHASYPSKAICRNSHHFRPLGLGYANLGSLIMSLGLPYDSNEGRQYAAAITAILTGTAYAASAELSRTLGPFPQFEKNREPMLNVLGKHTSAVDNIDPKLCPSELLASAKQAWSEAVAAGERFGFRNAQVSVLAPTGTIGFMMDCDTTGIEPDIALVKYKQLAGGGMFKIVNRTVPQALAKLGYTSQQIAEIVDYIDETDMIEDAPHLSEEDQAVFDCAFKPANGRRNIHYIGHIQMMGAVQPFLSGAISKTVNMPNDATADQIMQVYIDGWKLGLKSVAIYRDGSKRTQPITVSNQDQKKGETQTETISQEQLEAARREPHRDRLPSTRPSFTHKFDVAGHEGYLNVGLYEDGKPGELFITMAKEGSTVGGMMDAFATSISLCLQYGVPLEALVKKFSHQRFEPSGMTSSRDIPFAKSIVDYIFRWLGITFLEDFRKANLPRRGESTKAPTGTAPEAVKDDDVPSEIRSADAAPDTEVAGAAGALFGGRYESIWSNSGGGNGDSAKAPVSIKTSAAPLDATTTQIDRIDKQFTHYQEDAPPCDVCGSITVRNGNCYRCHCCGSSLGCS